MKPQRLVTFILATTLFAAPAFAQTETPPTPDAGAEGKTTDATLAGTVGLVLPGVASYVRGDAAGGAFHMYTGMQSLGFFIGAMANLEDRGAWDNHRTGVAAATAAAIYGLNYLASIARAGGRLPTEGTTTDSMRLRLSISTVVGGRADDFDDGYGDVVASGGQQVSLGIMAGPVVEIAALVESLYGDFDEDERDDRDYGLSVGAQLNFHIPTGTIVHPYLGISGAYHPKSPLLGTQLGLAVALSPRIELFFGGRLDMSTAHDPALGRAMGQFGFTRAF